MSDLATELRAKWSERFGTEFGTDDRAIKDLRSPQEERLFQVLYSNNLEQWYRCPKGKKRYNAPRCFFCEEHDEYELLETLVQIDHLRVYYKLNFAARFHFLIVPFSEHRDYPSTDDITVLRKLALASGLSILCNFKESGASYPQHVHYQSLEMEFPIVQRPVETVFSTDVLDMARVDYPIAAFRLSTASRDGVEIIAKALPLLPLQYNLLFYQEDIFLIPRTRSVPFNTGGFKFATAEVCGVVFTRTKEMYESFDYEMMMAALADVCLARRGPDIEGFEERLIRILKSRMDEIQV